MPQYLGSREDRHARKRTGRPPQHQERRQAADRVRGVGKGGTATPRAVGPRPHVTVAPPTGAGSTYRFTRTEMSYRRDNVSASSAGASGRSGSSQSPDRPTPPPREGADRCGAAWEQRRHGTARVQPADQLDIRTTQWPRVIGGLLLKTRSAAAQDQPDRARRSRRLLPRVSRARRSNPVGVRVGELTYPCKSVRRSARSRTR